ncbi:stress response protein NST1-like [Telopea speciosissima]|uniref:stress response protein NST1-like n=1 Tax=Telopea speciosissima TaxID=54955 RepID=UPI001CC44973|nr:stress response protein NST1-like [Telopea speciosissima]
MKRKKWTEEEEETLINKYSELLNSGTLGKLKTREKKFEPIADHVNSVHHLQDPVNYPFRWSWRDVSIKVQNMRHQYLGVKQKIRVSDDEFNWKDGENHWQNFLKYKEVFGDVELEVKDKGLGGVGEDDGIFGYENFVDGGDDLGIGLGLDCEDLEVDGDEGGAESDGDDGDDSGLIQAKRLKRSDWGGLGLMGAQVLELRDMMVRREEKRREREFNREEAEAVREQGKRDREKRKEERRKERDGWMESREFEWEERQRMWARREFERRLQLERELDDERRRRMKVEEDKEQEEMEWRERMVGMQIEHEKQMMQMHADACQNQMQILGVLVRLMCQFIGPGNDALAGGLGGLGPQVLQNLQHPGSLVGDNGKPDVNSPSHFM